MLESLESYVEMFAEEAMKMPDGPAFTPVKGSIEALGGPAGFAKDITLKAGRFVTDFCTMFGLADRDLVGRCQDRIDHVEHSFDRLAEYIEERDKSGAAPEPPPASLPASQPLDHHTIDHLINVIAVLIMDGLNEEQARAFLLSDAPPTADGWGVRSARRWVLEQRRIVGHARAIAVERMALVPVVFSVLYRAAEREQRARPEPTSPPEAEEPKTRTITYTPDGSPLHVALRSLADDGWTSDQARAFIRGMPWRHLSELHGNPLKFAALIQELLQNPKLDEHDLVERITSDELWQHLAASCGFR